MTSGLLSPIERYQRDLQTDGFQHDPAQEQAVGELQGLYERLKQPVVRPGWWARLTGERWLEPVRGLYFWGGVGRGKTYLMDNFYESLPFERKMRVHFHRFMRRVHGELRQLAGQKNPLEQVAENIAAEARVICFDEFFVSDITDAMILAGLLDGLFRRGVTLVTTSNIEPAGLYKDGLQRARFLPAIALLEKHTQIVNVDGGVDYRLRALEQAELYYSPLGAEAQDGLEQAFKRLCPPGAEVRHEQRLEVEGRYLMALRLADDVAWFSFAQLCDGPRSQNDYIELAREFHAVIVSGVPQLGRDRDDQTRRFINLVDEFYDRNVKLVVSAEVELSNLYAGGRLSFEIERTQSRLLEMRSHEYLARPHRP
ncbi:cell division protein ZapE [Gilvimarinus sp. SDUM040013]|uniref:Cell division protein ZapE n=1 Tax=Gilvimarinus gilvus TaxID=3058038 RepID=A0ABU4RY39_9GAMM|nr:cell division protein ZapE [Gilvimarinus sp. SDUM040013]MDO3388334.1 cell division protein ZapE [Gilvimarinus sp. SDUM040013]MDX6847884.1 cell division protein ZapE [Gilvimarinus sp. SDUM040013]